MKRGHRKAGKARTPRIGIVEWFRPGEYERVETVLADLRALGVRELRTGICWADWYASEGDGWYAWLLPRLAQDVNILPCFLYTPPSLGHRSEVLLAAADAESLRRFHRRDDHALRRATSNGSSSGTSRTTRTSGIRASIPTGRSSAR